MVHREGENAQPRNSVFQKKKRSLDKEAGSDRLKGKK